MTQTTKEQLAEQILKKHWDEAYNTPRQDYYIGAHEQLGKTYKVIIAAIVEAMNTPAKAGMTNIYKSITDKEINDKAKKHCEDFPDNSPYRSYKTGYHHALLDIALSGEKQLQMEDITITGKEMKAICIDEITAEAEVRYPVKTHYEPSKSPYKAGNNAFIYGAKWAIEQLSAPAKEVEAISDSEEPKKTLVISAFPGTGKSYLSKLVNSLDSDSSSFSWLPNTKIRNGQFPFNYIQNIKRNLGKYDFIFVSSHKEVRTCMIQHGIDFLSAYPDKSLKEEYLKRYKDRGNDLDFIEMMDKNWDLFIDGMGDLKCMKPLILKSGEYLADYFLLNNGIKEPAREAISVPAQGMEELVNALDACFGVMMQPYLIVSEKAKDKAHRLGVSLHTDTWNEARARAEKMYYEAKKPAQPLQPSQINNQTITK